MSNISNLDWRNAKLEEILSMMHFKEINDFDLKVVKDLASWALKFSQSIWNRNIYFENYTIHHLKHSFSLIDHFEGISEFINFTDYEKFIFLIASFIHDIGMQYPYFGDVIGEDFSKLKKIRKNKEEIRKKHCQIGFDLIKNICEGNITKCSSIFDITAQNQDILFEAAYIAFSHSDFEILKEMRFGSFKENMKNHIKHGKYNYRPFLLFAIISLCDLLDDNCRRIEDFQKFDSKYPKALPKKNKIYWYVCNQIEDYYYQPDITNKEKIIRIRWKSDYKNESIIREYLNKQYISRINLHIAFCKQLFRLSSNYDAVFPIFEASIEEHPFGTTHKIPKDIQNLIIEYMDSPLPSYEIDKLASDVDSIEKEIRDIEIIEKTYISDDKKNHLKSRLKDWIHLNRIYKPDKLLHFALSKGEHSDTFIESRLILLEPELTDSITDYIFNKYHNKQISCILGIGTTAINFSSSVGIRLGIKSTYTFSHKKKQNDDLYHHKEKQQKQYLNYEIETPAITKGEDLLIIDDIYSNGDVLFKILNDFDFKLGDVYFISLFYLGMRQIRIPYRIRRKCNSISIDYIAKYENIQYYPGDKEKCELCLSHWNLIDEENIYKDLENFYYPGS